MAFGGVFGWMYCGLFCGTSLMKKNFPIFEFYLKSGIFLLTIFVVFLVLLPLNGLGFYFNEHSLAILHKTLSNYVVSAD